MARHLTLPSSAFEDVQSLLRLDEAQLRSLSELFATSASIRPHSTEFMRKVTESLGLDSGAVESLVVVCQFLLTVVEEGNAPKDILNDVREFVVQYARGDAADLVQAFDRNRENLASLLTPKPERSKALKVLYLTHGLYPTVDSFRTVCELRPVFEGPKGKEAIVGFVPTIILEVRTSDLEGDERTYLLHISPDKLRDLKDTVARTEEKLAAIQARFSEDLLTG